MNSLKATPDGSGKAEAKTTQQTNQTTSAQTAETKPPLQRSDAARNLGAAPPLPPKPEISRDSDEPPPNLDRLKQPDEPVNAEEKPVPQRGDTTRDLGAPPPPSSPKPVISKDSDEPVQEHASAGNSVEDAQEKAQQHAEKMMMMSIQSDMQKMERETRAKIIKDEIEARGEAAAKIAAAAAAFKFN